jgi:hypothetical protein
MLSFMLCIFKGNKNIKEIMLRKGIKVTFVNPIFVIFFHTGLQKDSSDHS